MGGVCGGFRGGSRRGFGGWSEEGTVRVWGGSAQGLGEGSRRVQGGSGESWDGPGVCERSIQRRVQGECMECLERA